MHGVDSGRITGNSKVIPLTWLAGLPDIEVLVRFARLPGATENFLDSPCRFCTFSFDYG